MARLAKRSGSRLVFVGSRISRSETGARINGTNTIILRFKRPEVSFVLDGRRCYSPISQKSAA